jgi:K+-transporting ATPase KdpC subunit
MVADGARVLGVVELRDIVKVGIEERFAELRCMGIKTVRITGDNRLTAAAIAAEAGGGRLPGGGDPGGEAPADPRLPSPGTAGGHDRGGTNDAPALAQADVAVAMNTGTQAAKEDGNMVDPDSNPTKLIEIVKTGKQMLMTRGALTTFSITNDVAKYFAIIPAAFVSTYPGLGALNLMGVTSPASAILAAVIFNALIIVALIPLALKGVRYRQLGAAVLLRDNLLICGLGGVLLPFLGVKLIDLLRPPAAGLKTFEERPSMLQEIRPALVSFLLLTALIGLVYPFTVTGVIQLLFPRQAGGSLIIQECRVVGSTLIGQPFSDPGHFWGRPSATAPWPYNAASSGGSNLGPTSSALIEEVKTQVATLRAADPGNWAPIPVDLVATSASGLDPHISPAAAAWQINRVARARGLDPERVRRLVATYTEPRQLGILGEPRVNALRLNLALDALAGLR